MAALARGTLGGVLADGAVRTWLRTARGKRLVLAWPRTFRARLTPLRVLDDHGRVLARGGESIGIGGGLAPPATARSPFVTWGDMLRPGHR
jgi:hypothetical protein